MTTQKLVWYECTKCLAVDLDPPPKPKGNPKVWLRCGRCGASMTRRVKKVSKHDREKKVEEP